MTEVRLTTPVLETERLRLRAPTVADWPVLADFYASPRAKFVGGPMTKEQVWRTLAVEIGHWPMRGFGRFAIEEKATGAFVGLCGPWRPEDFPELEIGWDLMNGYEGRGYATEAALAARAFVYGDLGVATPVISLIAPANEGSKGVAGRLGAAFEKMFRHEVFGEVEIWRHPAPEALK